MATFGEITEPSSRATFEDWDDLAGDYNLPKLQWQLPLDVPEEVGKFFIFEGKCLWSGVRARKNMQEVNSIKEVNLHLYKTPRNNHFVAVIKDFELGMCNEVTKLLKDLITKSKMIVTIQEKPMVEYQTYQTPLTPHIIRKITTTNTSNLMRENLPKLEQPNIITGVSAGVFTLREHLGLSATAIVIYMENTQENQLDGLETLLQRMDMTGTAQVMSNVTTAISNLYV